MDSIVDFLSAIGRDFGLAEGTIATILGFLGIKKGKQKVQEKRATKPTTEAIDDRTNDLESSISRNSDRIIDLCDRVNVLEDKADDLTDKLDAVGRVFTPTQLTTNPPPAVLTAADIDLPNPPPIVLGSDWAPNSANNRDGTLGFRNNNPGCLVYNRDPSQQWKGLADPPNDGPFCRFEQPVWGVRALVRIALNYRKRKGIRTFREHCHEWCPLPPAGRENDRLFKGNDPDNYAVFISGKLGLKADDEIPLDTLSERAALAKAIAIKECGRDVLKWPESVWLDGAKAERR